MINLHGLRMYVSSTAADGVVGADTRLEFIQKGARVAARYEQVEASGAVHGGDSECVVERLNSGRIRIIERFTWTSRPGSGTNVFDEMLD